ncbi:MAG: hypothetical protein MZU97_23075 [Bacillus subtilis]|nr:hypothetical protein [Bacillus subtilis]
MVQHQFPEAFPVSTSTVRRWIDNGCLSVRRIDPASRRLVQVQEGIWLETAK